MKKYQVTSLIVLTVAALVMGGCMQKSPQQRLERAETLLQQQDTLGARLECQDIIGKYPSAPETPQARLMLAQIYANEQQPDEAIGELKQVMASTSQETQIGQIALQGIVGLEIQRGHTDKALEVIDGVLNKEAKGNAYLEQGLNIMKSEVLIAANQTTEARALLTKLCAETTATDVQNMLKNRITESFVKDGDYANAKKNLKDELAAQQDDARKLYLYSKLVEIEVEEKNDADARATLTEMTTLYNDLITKELNTRKQFEYKQILFNAYASSGNYVACEAIIKNDLGAADGFETAFPSVQNLAGIYLREGKTSDILDLLSDMVIKYPNGPFAEIKTRIEGSMNNVKVEDMIDTRSLALSLMKDPIMPKIIAPETTATLSNDNDTSSATAEASSTQTENIQ